jgi:hypothetical protein
MACAVQNLIPDTLLCLQHPPVYTLGKRGVQEHFKVPESEVRFQFPLSTIWKESDQTLPLENAFDTKQFKRTNVEDEIDICCESAADFASWSDH